MPNECKFNAPISVSRMFHKAYHHVPWYASSHAGVSFTFAAVHVRMLRCDERVPSRRELIGKAAELVRLPEGHSGELLVIRVFERVSYALVRSAERAVRVGDRVVSPGV